MTYSALRIGPDRKMFTSTCRKKILDCHDSKRWVYPCQTDSMALGHYLTLDSLWVQKLFEWLHSVTTAPAVAVENE